MHNHHMKTVFVIFIIIGSVTCSLAQRAPYKFSWQIDSIFKSDSDDQHEGINYAYIGNYKKALKIFSQYNSLQKLSKSAIDSFKLYKVVNAKQYILEAAKHTRVVILNEAHHMPLHRVFAQSLLLELHNEGFNELGMETFDNADSLIVLRGHPEIKSGWYSAEPCYGNMIRTALNLNYRLFGYEMDGGGEREKEQAKNIAKELEAHPESRILIYCGYDHFIKDTMPGADSWHHAMAGWLKLFTGIEPLTIDQVTLSETGVDSMDNAYRKLMSFGSLVVMINDSGKSLMPKRKYNADITVYHPNTSYIHGRPGWQVNEGRYLKNISAKINIGFPCLAFVYREGENYELAVPTDIVELTDKHDDMQVILEKQYKNVIVLKNRQGQRQVIEQP